MQCERQDAGRQQVRPVQAAAGETCGRQLVVSMMPMKRAGQPTKTNCWISNNRNVGRGIDAGRR